MLFRLLFHFSIYPFAGVSFWLPAEMRGDLSIAMLKSHCGFDIFLLYSVLDTNLNENNIHVCRGRFIFGFAGRSFGLGMV